MTPEELQGELQRRAPGQWELYRKSAESHELEASRTLHRRSWRREEGWAARWHEGHGLRFAAASSREGLAGALSSAERVPVSAEDPPEWPVHSLAEAPGAGSPEEPPGLFEALSKALAAASRGEAHLLALSLRRGLVGERIWNGAGLDVAFTQRPCDGVAVAVGRRGARAHESRLPFRWTETADVDALARRLADSATLPLSDLTTPFAGGQWLLDPAVSAAMLAALAPIFCTDRPPRWLTPGRLTSPALLLVDDASSDAPFDGEGVATRRIVLAQNGARAGRLEDLRSARRTGRKPTGHGVRSSFRSSPRVSPRRIFFESAQPCAPAELLARVRRGLFASALTAPVRVDLAEDRYEVEFTGVSVVGGRAQGPVGGVRVSGRISELLRRVTALADDRQFFPMPFPAGSPTLLIEHAAFE